MTASGVRLWQLRKERAMGTYTQMLENKIYDISPEDDNYTEELIEVANLFRNLGEALDGFLNSNGYSGSLTDIDSKAAYIREKFRQASIPIPRNLKKYFTESKEMGKETSFQFCLAFGLNLMQAETFLRKICLKRGFDCHDMKEAIYYYSIKNHLDYPDVQRMLDRIPKKLAKSSIDFGKDVLYTSTIVEEINRLESPEELLQFFDTHKNQFGYNNATAVKYIRRIWEEIAGAGGLAYQEACMIPKTIFQSNDSKAEREQKEKLRYEERFTIIDKNGDVSSSVWNVYLQILGLGNDQVGSLPEDRSFKSVLKDNAALHYLAEESFPDRQGIEAVLNGKHVSNERVRKMLILLLFYRFWVKLSIKSEDTYYRAKPADAERCFSEINKYLLDAGYPELYFGNPYDWIFAWALRNEEPLAAFRYLIGELAAVKSEDICEP